MKEGRERASQLVDDLTTARLAVHQYSAVDAVQKVRQKPARGSFVNGALRASSHQVGKGKER